MIDESTFLEIIASLASSIHYKEVDELVNELEIENVFKYKGNKNIELAAYRKETTRKLIKVHSLAKYIKIPDDPHSYSVCVSGRYNEDSAEKLFIYNRYIDHSFVPSLLKNPASIEIIENFDHFLFFFLEKGTGKINVQANNFAAVSFWIKFSEIQEDKTVFFSTSDIKLYVRGNTIIAETGDQTISYEVDPLE